MDALDQEHSSVLHAPRVNDADAGSLGGDAGTGATWWGGYSDCHVMGASGGISTSILRDTKHSLDRSTPWHNGR